MTRPKRKVKSKPRHPSDDRDRTGYRFQSPQPRPVHVPTRPIMDMVDFGPGRSGNGASGSGRGGQGQGLLELPQNQEPPQVMVQTWINNIEEQMPPPPLPSEADSGKLVDVEPIDFDESDIPMGADVDNNMKGDSLCTGEPLTPSSTTDEIVEKFKEYMRLNSHAENEIIKLRLAQLISQFPYGISLTKFKSLFPDYLYYNIYRASPATPGTKSNEISVENIVSSESNRSRPGLFFTLVDDDVLDEFGRREKFIFPNFVEISLEIKKRGIKELFRVIWNQMLAKIPPPPKFNYDCEDLPNAISLYDLNYEVENKILLENWNLTLREFAEICLSSFSPEYEFLIKNKMELDEKVFIVEVLPKPTPNPEQIITQPVEAKYPTHAKIPEGHVGLGQGAMPFVSNRINPGEFHLVNWAEITSTESIGVRKVAYENEFVILNKLLNARLYDLLKMELLTWVDPNLLSPGLYVVVLCRGSWSRGIIYMDLGYDYYSIYLIDWGGFANLSAFNIAYMPKEVSKFPAFGIWCRAIFEDDSEQKWLSDDNMIWNKKIINGFRDKVFGNKNQNNPRAFEFVKKVKLADNISYWLVKLYNSRPAEPNARNSETNTTIQLDSQFKSLVEFFPKDGEYSRKPMPTDPGSIDCMIKIFAHLCPKRDGSMNYKGLPDLLRVICTLDNKSQNEAILI